MEVAAVGAEAKEAEVVEGEEEEEEEEEEAKEGNRPRRKMRSGTSRTRGPAPTTTGRSRRTRRTKCNPCGSCSTTFFDICFENFIRIPRIAFSPRFFASFSPWSKGAHVRALAEFHQPLRGNGRRGCAMGTPTAPSGRGRDEAAGARAMGRAAQARRLASPPVASRWCRSLCCSRWFGRDAGTGDGWLHVRVHARPTLACWVAADCDDDRDHIRCTVLHRASLQLAAMLSVHAPGCLRDSH